MLAAALIVLCVVVRTLPHPPNFAPVGATAVFAGRTLSPARAILLTCACMAISDLVLAQVYGWAWVSITTPFVYGGFAIQALLGRALRRRRGGSLMAAGLGATVFFALSNFGVWVAGGYGHSVTGLLACYIAALPFFAATLMGDLLWVGVLSLGYRALLRRLRPDEHAKIALPAL